jgi:GxxExxY protein
MDENELSNNVIGFCIEIHNDFGPGLFESVYEEVLCFKLKKNNLTYRRQQD